MTPLALTALILAVVIGTLTLWRLNEPGVRATVGFVEKIRVVLGAVFLSLIVWHFLRSGEPEQIAVAIGGLAFITAYILVEQPWTEVI